MKKSIIVVLCIAMLALNALTVLGVTDFSATSGPTGAFVITGPQPRSNLPPPAYGRLPQIRTTPGCNTKITVDPADVRFVGKAREECLRNNKLNIFCQRRCFDQLNLLVLGSSVGRGRGLYSTLGCKSLTVEDLSKSTPTSCYFDVHRLCQQANTGRSSSSDYCRTRCVHNSYNVCKQAFPRYGG